MTRECHSKLRCSGCGKKHHVSLCHEDSLGTGKSSGLGQGVESSPREATAGAEPQAPKLNVNAPPFPHQNTTSLYVAVNKTVLLQTALATIGHPHQPTVSQ